MGRAKGLIFLLAGLAMLIACTGSNIIFTISNDTGEVIQSVVVRFTGGEVGLGPLKAGESQDVTIKPTGESHIELEIKMADGKVELRQVDTYFEPSYSGRIKVSLGGGLKVHSEMKAN